MSILTIEVVGKLENKSKELSQQLADEAGRALEAPKGDVWIRIQELEPELFAVNETALSEIKPVFVSILQSSRPDIETRAALAKQLASKFSALLNRSAKDIHVLFSEDGKGRMAFGGDLR